MKTDWQTKKLGEVCDVFDDGDWIEKKDQSLEGIRLIQTGNMGVGYFKDRGEKARYISEKTFLRLNCTEILPGDCLISRLPNPVGRACIIPDTGEKMITAVDCTIIRFNHEVMPEWFINYSLSQEYQNQINKEVGGATRQRISRKHLGQIDIPVPPLSEQKRILGIFEEVFDKTSKAKENTEKNLKNSKELFESYLQNVFANTGKDWKENKLGNVCDTGAGGTPLKAHKDYYEGGTIPWLRSGEVDKKNIIKSELFITQKGLDNSSARLFPKDTVLIAMYGATAGQVGILRFESTTNQAVCGILPNKNFMPEYIYYVFRSKKTELVKQAVGGAQPNISQIKVKNTLIPVLPILEQKAIVKKLEALSKDTKKLENNYQHKLSDLDEFKKSILDKAFTQSL